MERSVDDAVNNFKLLTKDKRLVPGAGAVEVELSKRLSEKAEQVKLGVPRAQKNLGRGDSIIFRFHVSLLARVQAPRDIDSEGVTQKNFKKWRVLIRQS